MTQLLAERIAQDLADYLDEFHRYPQPYDEEMDAEIHEQYARVLREQLAEKEPWRKYLYAPDGTRRPTFSPSSAGSTERELYAKLIHGRKGEDPRESNSNQRDWTGLGSVVGDYIQRELLLAERHFEKLTGKPPRFKFKRTERNEPAYEHFMKKVHEVEHNGERFGLNGLPDGILEYMTDDGEIIEVGLEVKSFQKSYTEFKKHSEPKLGHELQTHVYNEMYGLDYTIVLYHLTYGADWKRDFSRNKCYGRYVPTEGRTEILDKFARVTKAWREKTPPALDLLEWNFNNYKNAIASDLTDAEFAELKRKVSQIQRSGLPQWRKQSAIDAYYFIEEVRANAKGHAN